MVALGNPLVLWSGLAAIVYCAVDWVRAKHWQSFVILFTYAALYLPWAVIPRAITFHYYYLCATMVLSLALTFVFYRTRMANHAVLRWGFLLCAAAMFIVFLPISSAAVGTTLARYNQLMWFPTWR